MQERVTIMGDGTELKRQHLESTVLCLDDDTRVVLAPWPQEDKAGETTNNKHLFEQTDLCQEAYAELHKACITDRTGLLPHTAPPGMLLTIVTCSNNGR